VFWDSSALVPLLLAESRSDALTRLASADRELTIWWGAPIECCSALCRRDRESPLPKGSFDRAMSRLRAIVEDSDVVAPTQDVRDAAIRLLPRHPLRSGDAQQLAAALIWCEGKPDGETLVCLDDRLREAARREGFRILPD
jgi:predicted nucleic acid-binding protein